MPEAVGLRAIDRTLASLSPGGTLELGFFGGEPLIDADLVLRFIEYALVQAGANNQSVRLGMTTNGTISNDVAWRLMLRNDMELTVSHDGLPRVHDRHRLTAGGEPTSDLVTETMRRLVRHGKPFHVNMVVRPDTVGDVAGGIRHLRELGVTHTDVSLDLWSHWDSQDAQRLQEAIDLCAEVWAQGLPQCGINWFDEKAARLGDVPLTETARCGFGNGELAVAPSGRLYPCERLIGEDSEDNPMRLAGHALEGVDFLGMQPALGRSHTACDACSIDSICNTTCRCSNYVRTGDVSRPDRLLCLLNECCTAAVMRLVQPLAHETVLQTPEAPL